MNFFKCIAGAHKWGREEPYDCICDVEEPCLRRTCKRCGYYESRINGVWQSLDHTCPLEKDRLEKK